MTKTHQKDQTTIQQDWKHKTILFTVRSKAIFFLETVKEVSASKYKVVLFLKKLFGHLDFSSTGIVRVTTQTAWK
jgi:hypothetical protein